MFIQNEYCNGKILSSENETSLCVSSYHSSFSSFVRHFFMLSSYSTGGEMQFYRCVCPCITNSCPLCSPSTPAPLHLKDFQVTWQNVHQTWMMFRVSSILDLLEWIFENYSNQKILKLNVLKKIWNFQINSHFLVECLQFCFFLVVLKKVQKIEYNKNI